MLSITQGLLAGVAAFAVVGLADAASVYSFDLTRQGSKLVDADGKAINAGINDKAGKVLSVSGAYNELEQTLSWSTTVAGSYNAMWLVLNNGGNPKTVKDEGKIGIVYFDLRKETLSVYQYTSKGGNSFQNGTLIASSEKNDAFIKALDVTTTNDHVRTGSFTLDVAGINTALGGKWQGLMFDETVGLWMHLFDGNKDGAKYNAAGGLTSWNYHQHGWVDTDGFATEQTNAVPTPSAALAGLMGLGILANRRKNRVA